MRYTLVLKEKRVKETELDAEAEKVRRETVYAPFQVQQGLRMRLRRSKALAKDAWLEGESPRHPTQFVQIEPLEGIAP